MASCHCSPLEKKYGTTCLGHCNCSFGAVQLTGVQAAICRNAYGGRSEHGSQGLGDGASLITICLWRVGRINLARSDAHQVQVELCIYIFPMKEQCSKATGGAVRKCWRFAPGAPHPAASIRIDPGNTIRIVPPSRSRLWHELWTWYLMHDGDLVYTDHGYTRVEGNKPSTLAKLWHVCRCTYMIWLLLLTL